MNNLLKVEECKNQCQYALDVGMPEYSCATTCEYFKFDAAIGRLVRLKLTSGNNIPVERCTITAKEVAAIDNKEV